MDAWKDIWSSKNFQTPQDSHHGLLQSRCQALGMNWLWPSEPSTRPSAPNASKGAEGKGAPGWLRDIAVSDAHLERISSQMPWTSNTSVMSEYLESLGSSYEFLDDSLSGVLHRCSTCTTAHTSARSRKSSPSRRSSRRSSATNQKGSAGISRRGSAKSATFNPGNARVPEIPREPEPEDVPRECASAAQETSQERKLRRIRLVSGALRRASARLRRGGPAAAVAPLADAFAPESFRRVPGFVFLARRVDLQLFPELVYFFFLHKRWPAFREIPRPFQRICNVLGIGRDKYKDMPAFAPEWLFHLQKMDNNVFWFVMRYFFDENKMPSWDLLPAHYVQWFRKLQLGEFEYPSVSDFGKMPEIVKMRLRLALEQRLSLTEKQFPTGRDMFVMDTKVSDEILRKYSLIMGNDT